MPLERGPLLARNIERLQQFLRGGRVIDLVANRAKDITFGIQYTHASTSFCGRGERGAWESRLGDGHGFLERLDRQDRCGIRPGVERAAQPIRIGKVSHRRLDTACAIGLPDVAKPLLHAFGEQTGALEGAPRVAEIAVGQAHAGVERCRAYLTDVGAKACLRQVERQ
jgi:hypothetical protein